MTRITFHEAYEEYGKVRPNCMLVEITGLTLGVNCLMPTTWTISAIQHHVRELQEWCA